MEKRTVVIGNGGENLAIKFESGAGIEFSLVCAECSSSRNMIVTSKDFAKIGRISCPVCMHDVKIRIKLENLATYECLGAGCGIEFIVKEPVTPLSKAQLLKLFLPPESDIKEDEEDPYFVGNCG